MHQLENGETVLPESRRAVPAGKGTCRDLSCCAQKIPTVAIVVSTNGILLNTDAKREAALYLSQIMFSVHGISDEMSTKYMLEGSFEKAYAAMKAMVAYRDARGLKAPVLDVSFFCSTGTTSHSRSGAPSKMAKEIGVDAVR